MRKVAIYSKVTNPISHLNLFDNFEMNGVPIVCGLLNSETTKFDKNLPENQEKVLVKIKAFSCNYRDKGLIFTTTIKAPENLGYVIGSDFVGEVIDTGLKVTKLQIGDRVIANNAFPKSGVPDVRPGVASNNSSKEYQVFHQVKLMKVPQEMPDEVAAAFSIGGQTSYSIIRKLNPTPGSHVLVTAAKSNTSLFVINALKKYSVNIYAITTSMLFAEELKAMGVKAVILVEPKPNSLTESQALQKIVSETGGFDCVFDPFFDLYLGQVVKLMVNGGKYISCGLYDQYLDTIGHQPTPSALDNFTMSLVMINNLQIIGNCLGLEDDLQNAIQDYASGNLNVVIDSVFTGKQIGAFFERTYNAKDRFGKVVYKYE